MCIENLKCIALAVPEIIANPNLGEEEVVGGRGWYHSKERWQFPISLHSNFSSVLTRFRDIAAFVLQHATFPTPCLVSPKFIHVHLGVGG